LMQKIVLKMVEEEYPEWREFMLCCVLVWRQKDYIILFRTFVWLKEQNVF
jgi:hypothetical protein